VANMLYLVLDRDYTPLSPVWSRVCNYPAVAISRRMRQVKTYLLVQVTLATKPPRYWCRVKALRERPAKSILPMIASMAL